MEFDAQVGEHKIILDASEEHGGTNLGTSPKPLLLVSLAGCTGMDVMSLARKMRVEFEKFEIEVEAEKSDDIPSVYTSMKLIYKFETREDLSPEKPLKMVALSQERYCGVAHMLRKVSQLQYEVYLNGKRIDR